MPTATDPPRARLRVELRDGRSVVTGLRSAEPIGLRQLAGRGGGGAVRVAVVQTAAMLVQGDDVRLDVHVGPGARLELEEVSATVAHPVTPGCASIAQSSRVVVEDGAALALLERPLVLAAGTRLDRRTDVVLAGAARCLHREVVVLGRAGEAPGAAVVRVRVVRDGRPVFDDALDSRDLLALGSAAVTGDFRAVGSVALYGAAAPAIVRGALALGPYDTLVRRLFAADEPPERELDALSSAWTAALTAAASVAEPVAA